MAVTTYTYSVSSDTANAKVSDTLQVEIGNSNIVIALNDIIVNSDVLDISFKDALSTGDKTTLDSVVNAHLGTELEPSPEVVQLDAKTKSKGIPKVAIAKRDGDDFISIVSHEWTDKTTWYQKSTRITGETLTSQTSLLYKAANDYWVNMVSGNIVDEDNISGPYLVKIYDNGVEVTSGFTIDYVKGEVLFTTIPTGPVTADYSYAGDSTWILEPNPGKIVNIEHAELDFTIDCTLSKTFFEIWVYNPLFDSQSPIDPDDPNFIPGFSSGNPLRFRYQYRAYKNMKDVVKIANHMQDTGPYTNSGISNKITRAVFDYAEIIELKSSQGTQLRVRIDNDIPFQGEFSSVTVYTTIEDEI